MASGMLGIAVSGLMAFQRSIETISHNIANVNTEGYSRQRVEESANPPELRGRHYVGTGVYVATISRSYDQFINGQLRASTSGFAEVDRYRNFASQVDNLVADPSTGIDPAMQRFFNAVNDVANDPASIEARQVMLSEGDNLTQRFAVVNGRFEDLRKQVDFDLTNMTETINNYTTAIADLNVRISNEIGRSGGKQPNDLLDQRDTTLKKLAQLVDISIVPQNNNMVSVIMGKGHSLVLDGTAFQMGTQSNAFDPEHLDVTLQQGTNKPYVINDQLSGGEMAGVLRFRSEMLDPAQQQIGSVAAAIAMGFNAVHEKGFDLNGTAGNAFFKFNGLSEVPSRALATNTGTATVTAAFNNINTNPTGASVADIDSSDYLLKYDGANYTLTRLTDQSVMALTATGAGPITLAPTSATEKLPGITLSLDAVPATNDQFVIRPTFQAAAHIAMNISDARQIAAATNLDQDGITLIAGAMPGDNRNALQLAALANQTLMLGGKTTLHQAYGQMVTQVGSLTHKANIGATAQEALLNRANETRENLAGVNLDEEAANLIKYQQSYQAAAQAISTSSALFDSLLGAVR